MKFRQVSTFVFAFVASLFFASRVDALTVSPAVVDYDLNPGGFQSGKINVYNESDQDFYYVISTQRFQAGANETGEPEIISEDTDNAINDLKDWIVFKGDRGIKLSPGQSNDFEFDINVPQNAEPGGHYAVIFFTRSSEIEGQSGVGLGAKLGVLVLVNVSGDTKESANFESFTIKNAFISHLPAEMSLRIKNNGTNHFRPKGNVTIKNIFGQESVKIPANMNKSAVLPGGVRRLDTWWVKDTEAVKDTGFVSGLVNEWKNFGFGYYKATAFVTYGVNDTELAPMSVSFWVFPWRLTILFILILVVLFTVIKLYNKVIVSSAIRKQKS